MDVVTRKGECEIIRGCHNRDKGTAENERLRDLKFIFSYPKNERLIFLDLKAVERLRKTAEQLSRQERDKSHDRGSDR